MTTAFPGAIDAFTNPTATDALDSATVPHAAQHADINDAVEALEAKVAIGNTVLGTYTAYTPTAVGLTVGNGTITGSFCRVNNFVHVHGTFVFGSTSSVTGIIQPSLPVNINSGLLQNAFPFGFLGFSDASAGTFFPGHAMYNGQPNSFFTVAWSRPSTYVQGSLTSATVPFTWATNDVFSWNVYYKAA